MSNASESFKYTNQPKYSYKRERMLLTAIPNDIPTFMAKDIVDLRKQLQLSQSEFANVLGITPMTLKRWESGRILPPKSSQHFLYLIKQDPEKMVKHFVTITRNDQQTRLPLDDRKQ